MLGCIAAAGEDILAGIQQLAFNATGNTSLFLPYNLNISSRLKIIFSVIVIIVVPVDRLTAHSILDGNLR